MISFLSTKTDLRVLGIYNIMAPSLCSEQCKENNNDSAASGCSVHVGTSSPLFRFPVNYSLRAAVLAGYAVVSIKGRTLAAVCSLPTVCLWLKRAGPWLPKAASEECVCFS